MSVPQRPQRPIVQETYRPARGGGVAAVQALKLIKEVPSSASSKGCPRWIGAGSGRPLCSSDWQWKEAFEKTQAHERSLRAEEARAKDEARQRAEAEEEAHCQKEELLKQQKLLRQQRVEALLSEKAERLQRAAQEAERQKAAEDGSFASAVVAKKAQEKELRAMAQEELRVGEELRQRAAAAQLLEDQARRESEALARAEVSKAEAAAKMLLEDVAMKVMQVFETEAAERRAMAAADKASRLSEQAFKDTEWKQHVRRKKEQLQEERLKAEKAEADLAKEAKAEQLLAQVVKRQCALMSENVVAEVLEGAAEDFLKKAEAREEASRAEKRLAEERRAFELEDRCSLLRQDRDSKSESEKAWQQAVAARKAEEQELRRAEERETAAMSRADAAAREMRLRERQEEEKRHLEEITRLTGWIASQAYVAKIVQEAAENAKEQEAALLKEAETAAKADAIARKEAAEKERAQQRAQDAEAKRLADDRRAMALADRQAQEMRRDEVRRFRQKLQMEREFRTFKAEHLRQKEEQKKLQAEASLAKQAAEAEAILRQSDLDTHEGLKQWEAEARREAEIAEGVACQMAAEKNHRKVREELRIRQELLAEEARQFEELYRQNRSLVSSVRCSEEMGALRPDQEEPANSVGDVAEKLHGHASELLEHAWNFPQPFAIWPGDPLEEAALHGSTFFTS